MQCVLFIIIPNYELKFSWNVQTSWGELRWVEASWSPSTLNSPLYFFSSLFELQVEKVPLFPLRGESRRGELQVERGLWKTLVSVASLMGLYVESHAQQRYRSSGTINNGWKKLHTLKYQGLLLADGIIWMFGPINRRWHNACIFWQSTLPDLLRQYSKAFPKCHWYTHVDWALQLIYPMELPFKSMVTWPMASSSTSCPCSKVKNLSQLQKWFNADISAVCVSIEWSFGKVLNLFTWVNFKPNQKLCPHPIALYYLVTVILTATLVCMVATPATSLPWTHQSWIHTSSLWTMTWRWMDRLPTSPRHNVLFWNTNTVLVLLLCHFLENEHSECSFVLLLCLHVFLLLQLLCS